MVNPRYVTAAVLAPAVLAGMLWLPTAGLAALFGFFLLAGAWEWAALAGFESSPSRVVYTVLTAVLAAACYPTLLPASAPDAVFALASAWWVVAGALIVVYQVSGVSWLRGPGQLSIIGWCALLPAWLGILWLHARSPGLLIGLFLLIWLADTAAYLGGRRWGKRKLASRVSPGKTWFGVGSAVVAVAAAAGVAAFVWTPLAAHRPLAMVCAALTVVAAVIGDLFESLVKRRRGVKDSGNLLPGHGGVLDRIDSLLAAAPIYAYGVNKMVHLL
jgi:phosphatidate cytidylyltransferase